MMRNNILCPTKEQRQVLTHNDKNSIVEEKGAMLA